MIWNTIITEPIKAMFTRVSEFLPSLVSVIVILVLGYLIAKVIEKIFLQVLKLVRLDIIAEKAGIAKFLAKGEIKHTLSELISILIYWLVMLVVFISAANVLNLTITASLLDRIVLYIPKVIASVFILVLGLFFASILAGAVRSTTSHIGIAQSKFLGQITQTVIVIFSTIIALEQLGIAISVLNLTLSIIIGALGLAIAIAFGLGCKDIAGKFVNEIINKMKSGR